MINAEASMRASTPFSVPAFLNLVSLTSLILVTGFGCEHKQQVFPSPVMVTAAVPQSPYAQALSECLYGKDSQPSCSLLKLPYLGQETQARAPTVDEVMARVAVSRPWMAVRFRQVLEKMPESIRYLARSVTGIVIAEDMRRSGYYPFTGAIYIDPQYLWLTQQEKSDLVQNVGGRPNQIDQLNWIRLWRYVTKNGTYAYKQDGFSSSMNRTLDDIVYINTALLAHALALAADVLPGNTVNDLPREESPYAVQKKRPLVSEEVAAKFPLTSTLTSLAPVLANEIEPSQIQKTIPASQVGVEFSKDFATDLSSYKSSQEDLGFIIEELIMLVYMGIERDIAFAQKPTMVNPVGNDYTVAWGQRKRITRLELREKVNFVASKLLPNESIPWNMLGNPKDMTSGKGWLDNLVLP